MKRRRTYVIAYDSPSDARRARMLARVQGFGLDPQLSFHECSLTAGERREVWRALCAASCADEDRLILVRLDPRSASWRLGGTPGVLASPPALTYVG